MKRDDFKCCNCGDAETMLHVHHKKYITGKKPWEYKKKFLVTLCETCHENEHLKKDVSLKDVMIDEARKNANDPEIFVDDETDLVMDYLVFEEIINKYVPSHVTIKR